MPCECSDYSVYFDNRGIIQPTDLRAVAHYMQQDEIVVRQDNGLYAITNLGAILLQNTCQSSQDYQEKPFG